MDSEVEYKLEFSKEGQEKHWATRIWLNHALGGPEN